MEIQKTVSQDMPVGQIVVNPAALRTVNFETADFAQLVTSVRSNGILQPILVRELVDPETKKKYHGLIDGAHRLEAAKQAGLKEIPVIIKTGIDDNQALVQQAVANLQKVETKPFQYSQALRRMITHDPTLTLPKLSDMLGQPYEWVKQRLSLTGLTEEVGALLDSKKIPLASAYAISKLPPEEQLEYAKQAVIKPAGEILEIVTARKKQLNEEARQGTTETEAPKWTPVIHQRKWSEIKAAIEDAAFIKAMAKKLKGKTPEEIVEEVLKWCAHADAESLEEQKRKFDEAQKAKEEKAAKRAEERARKKAEAAAAAAAKAQAELKEAVK